MAGLGRRVFTPGEVLTATNVMGYLQDQAVMNFAGTAARGSAIGTAVSEGMVSYLADSNVVQAYDGSAWNSLAYATAVPTLAQVGLVPMVPPTVNYSGGTATANSLGVITFTNVTSISLNSVFTSEYTHYEIKTQNTNFSAGNNLQYRMRASGTDSTANTYYTEGLAVRLSTTTLYGGLATNGYIHSTYALSGAFSSSTIKLSNPAKAQYTTGNVEAHSLWSDGGSYGQFSGIIHQTATAYDGITLYPATGTMTGTVQVYGYKE